MEGGTVLSSKPMSKLSKKLLMGPLPKGEKYPAFKGEDCLANEIDMDGAVETLSTKGF
jgi:hypothetical protein